MIQKKYTNNEITINNRHGVIKIEIIFFSHAISSAIKMQDIYSYKPDFGKSLTRNVISI